MLTGSSSSPFAPIESVVYSAFFAGPSPSSYTTLTTETETLVVKKPSTATKKSIKEACESLIGAAPGSPSKTAAHKRGKGSPKKAKEQPESTETESNKKSD